MLDVCLLGTGGMMPLKNRRLTSLYARYNGSCILIDCGEGTQVAIREAGFSFKPIDILCFTHFHADHISGLPGLLLGMGNEGRTEPVKMIGPKGLKRVVNALRIIAPELPFEIEFIEIDNAEPIEFDGFSIIPFPVRHRITCFGYAIEIKRKGKFMPDKAKELEIPVRLWKVLQNGENVEVDGKVIKSGQVMGNERKGLKVVYCTDTRPTDSIWQVARHSDLLVLEGMFYDEEKHQRAKETGHMMFAEAAYMALRAETKELWLTHFSPAVVHPNEGIEIARAEFPNTKIGVDGMIKTLKFDDDA